MEDALSAPLASSEAARRTMVDCQIRTFDVTDGMVIARCLAVPREKFLPAALAPLAYSDMALRCKADGGTRTLLPPLVLARLLQGAAIQRGDRVLDVAPATGYSTALLAGMAGEVIALEPDTTLAAALRTNLDGFGLDRVEVRSGSMEAGAQDAGPFDIVVINGGIQAGLDALLTQLKPRGRLVAIEMVGAGHAVRFERIGGDVSRRVLFDAAAPVLAPFLEKPAFVF